MTRIIGQWQLAVASGDVGSETRLAIDPPASTAVHGEPHALGETGMSPLRTMRADGSVPCDRLDAASLVVSADPDGREPFKPGADYTVEPSWAFIGRCAGGRIAPAQTVYASYRYGLARIDAIARTSEGEAKIIAGTPHPNCPRPPALPPGHAALANVWVPGGLNKLAPENIMPILETACPPLALPADYAQRLLPRTMAALRQGRPLRVLAWGDSVTAASWLPAQQRWAQRFAAWLEAHFPAAKVELVVAAWPAHTSMDFLLEPPGSEHNYAQTVLAPRPDLVISEFVNDAKILDEAATAEQYARYLADFRAIGAEWIILTPHYVQPSKMGFASQKETDEDRRPFVRGLRRFAAENGVALADASRRWGRLWRQGIPYTTLLGDGAIHPTAEGLSLFVDALGELFTAR